MTAKEKQKIFITDYLKPLLKKANYHTIGNTWWKIQGDFFNVIQLQNFSWNSQDRVNFTFNFTTGFTKNIKNKKKVTLWDGITYIRESYFGLSKGIHWSINGFHIDKSTDIADFTIEANKIFEMIILPKLELLDSGENILNFYTDDFWSPRLKESILQNTKLININHLKD